MLLYGKKDTTRLMMGSRIGWVERKHASTWCSVGGGVTWGVGVPPVSKNGECCYREECMGGPVLGKTAVKGMWLKTMYNAIKKNGCREV